MRTGRRVASGGSAAGALRARRLLDTRMSVGVVIPAYNAQQWISKTLDSVLAQTRKPEDVLVVDDCSSDQTVEIVRAYADRGIRLCVNSSNLGRYATQNRAMQGTDCDLVAKVDADDLLEPAFLEELAGVLECHPSAGFATCDFRVIDLEGRCLNIDRRLSPVGLCRGRTELSRFVRANRARGTCVVFRRKFLSDVGWCDERFVYNGDWWLFLCLLACGDYFYQNEVLACYRQHSVGKRDVTKWEIMDHRLAFALMKEGKGGVPAIGSKDLARARRQFAFSMALAIHERGHGSDSSLYQRELSELAETALARSVVRFLLSEWGGRFAAYYRCWQRAKGRLKRTALRIAAAPSV